MGWIEETWGYPTIPNSSPFMGRNGRKLPEIVEKSLLCDGGHYVDVVEGEKLTPQLIGEAECFPTTPKFAVLE